MTKEELYSYTISKLTVPVIHDIHKSMFKESCEMILKSNPTIHDKELLCAGVLQAVYLGHQQLGEILKATHAVAENVNLNYDGKSYKIGKESKFINS